MNNNNKDTDREENEKDKWNEVDKLAKLVAGNLMKIPPKRLFKCFV